MPMPSPLRLSLLALCCALRAVSAGIPELDVPGIEPLHLKDINVTPVQNSRIPRFRAMGHNVEARGLGDFKIHKIE